MNFIFAYNFPGNMSIITLKTILSWKNKSGNAFVSIRWRASKMTKLNFISWFTSAVIGSLGVITNRIKTTTAGSSVTLIVV